MVGFGIGLACGPPAAFVCQSDGQCTGGTCEPGGYCSFPDDSCPSRARFGEHAPAGIANECVTPPGDDTDGGTSSTPSDSDDGTVGESSTSGSSDGQGDTLALTSGATTTGADTGELDDSSGESTGAPLDPDLVLWLAFDDANDPFADGSAYSRTVQCDGGRSACPQPATPDDDSLGVVFDGLDDALEIPHDPALETDAGLTVALWVRNDLLGDHTIHSFITRPYGPGNDNAWELFFRDQDGDGTNDLVFEIADNDGQRQLIVPVEAGDGEWQHVTAVWTPDTIALHVDGELETSAPVVGMLLEPASVFVGADRDSGVVTHHFVGAIHDVRVYRRALDDAEIAELLSGPP